MPVVLTSDPQLRLCPTPADTGPGLPDGARWPRSRDLARELPSLVEAPARRWGCITRVTVNPRFRRAIPRKVAVRGHVVHVGWFGEQDPRRLLLLSCTVGRWDLLVIPPRSSEVAAAHLMTAATGSEGHRRTAAALVAEEAPGTVETDRDRETAGESEAAPSSGPGDASGPARPAHRTEKNR
ncbi:DUF5994 family protein [Streptomyces meridianus]|uniref:DUF5994 family protein n=1 Tax=Streptomyces meridianus TaxID=2938945 RepID=UPI0027E26862|nr:DUF5994 family protein [Streptomyces meridianus]